MTIKSAYTLLLAACCSTAVLAQADPCGTWETLSAAEKDKAIENHTLYRDQVKAGNFDGAFPLWKAVYEAAPGADGNRSLHYSDGRDIYLAKFQEETDEAKKQEYSDMVMKLYAEHHQCYPKESEALYSNEIYNMFYVLKRPYEEEYDILMAAKELADAAEKDLDFRILAPMGYITQYQYSAENISADEARNLIEEARAIAEKHEAMDDATDYQTAIETHDAAVKGIEPYVFDCDYFMPVFEKEYGELPSYATDDKDALIAARTPREDLVRRMLGANCSRDNVAMIEKLDTQIEEIARKVYAMDNPMTIAKQMYESGDVDGALAEYEKVAATAEPQLQGSIYLQMASIHNVDKNSKSQARNYARKAAAARPGWGKPYLLIGDLYASSSRSCSTDPFEQRLVILAAMNQYARAKSDPETAGTAQSRINKYSSSAPTKEMIFQRGLKSGASASTGCWVGESVTLP